MKILVIGGTGHMGSFLVPMLLSEGHEVYVGTRTNTQSFNNENFDGAKFIKLNAKSDSDIEALKSYNFDTVIDFPGCAYRVWQILKNDISHLIACGSLWMFGYPNVVPTPEKMQNECLFAGYKQRGAEILKMAEESGKCKAVFTAIMPPNISGPGKIPIDIYADRSTENHKAHSRGEKVYLPDGPEALISPCDAEDLASLFALAANNRDAAAGEIFNVGSGDAVTFGKLVEIYGEIYGVNIPVERVSWEKFTTEIVTEIGAWWHFYAHMCPDFSKAERLLGYKPKYGIKATLTRSVEWMKKEGLI